MATPAIPTTTTFDVTASRPITLSALLAVAVLVPDPLAASRLIVNVTPSVPVGLYWIVHNPPARGNFVLITLPPKYRDLAVARGYLQQGQQLLKASLRWTANTRADVELRYGPMVTSYPSGDDRSVRLRRSAAL